MSKTRNTISIEHRFSSLNCECLVEFTGYFEPYWPGVRYYPDGTGEPPTGPDFDIQDTKFVSGNLLALIQCVESYYSSSNRTRVDSFFDDLSFELAERLQKINDDLESKYEREIDERIANSIPDED